MTKIYTVEESARIMNAMRAAELGNNGYAVLSLGRVTIEALETAGYTVRPCLDLFGLPASRVFTAAGLAAFDAETDNRKLEAEESAEVLEWVRAYEHAYPQE